MRNISGRFFSGILMVFLLCFGLSACGKNANSYSSAIQILEDDSYYAVIEANDEEMLLVSQDVYDMDDRNVSTTCDVYVKQDDSITKVKTLSSDGTAYPLCANKEGIYIGGPHYCEKYSLENSEIILVDGVYVEYDSDGKAAYKEYKNGEKVDIDEEKYNSIMEQAEKNDTIIFSKK